MYLPNLITLFRLLLVPVIVWLVISGRLQSAFIACIAAGLSDAADGYLARRFAWKTDLGAVLDPLADKALLISLYITFGVLGFLPVWLPIGVVSRDILIIGAVMLAWLMQRPMAMRPLPLSKVNTGAQVLLAVAVLAERSFMPSLASVMVWLIWIVAALTVATAGAYMWLWLKHMSAANGPARRRAEY